MAWSIFEGDALTTLRTLPSDSVRACITSPPYFGLRDYQTTRWSGGDPACDHRQTVRTPVGVRTSTLTGSRTTTNHQAENAQCLGSCGRCGATRQDSQIGLESTPLAYVAALVAVFAEVQRVLTPDGTLWLNLGDSYAGYHGNARVPDAEAPSNKPGYIENMRASTVGLEQLKPKDLMGMPWRVALALQDAGWYLRCDVIWHKPNTMPESVTDRPTRAHEYLFLLTKNERYYYNADAVREPYSFNRWSKKRGQDNSVLTSVYGHAGKTSLLRPGAHEFFPHALGRNRRSVWRIPTQSYHGAHFAVMPPALVEPCVRAGSQPGDLVLDPFCGAGTVGLVALREQRSFVGIDLNPAYCKLARERIIADAPLFNAATQGDQS